MEIEDAMNACKLIHHVYGNPLQAHGLPLYFCIVYGNQLLTSISEAQGLLFQAIFGGTLLLFTANISCNIRFNNIQIMPFPFSL